MKTLNKMQAYLLSVIQHENADKKRVPISVGRFKTNPNILSALERRGLITIQKTLTGTWYCTPV